MEKPVIAVRLEERLAALNMGQSELARRVEMKPQGIQSIAAGKVARPKKLREIAAALRTTEAYLLGEVEEPEETPQSRATPVAVISWVSAGALISGDAVETLLNAPRIWVDGLEPGDWIALEVDGDSMDRISPPGSTILVNRGDRRLVANACYVISDDGGGATYKRYRPNPDRFEPVSTNPAHEPIYPDHTPVIVGRVRKTMLNM